MIVNNKKISLSSYFKAHKIILLILILDFFGIWVPRFCYHRKLSSSGNCRMCLIEVKGSLKPLVACCTIVHSKMIVYTNTILIRKSREFIMEFLLINHPLDCPICDQSGECDLQDLSCVFGTDASRFIESKKAILNKQLGSLLIRTNMNRCIYCTRCVRYTSEINNTYLFNTLGRGNKTEIGNYNLKDIHRSNYIDGNVLDLCPVGALTGKAYSFRNKVWEQISIESVDILDSACSNIRIDLRNNIIERILPRTNDNLNEEWITDKIRFCYDGFRKQRLSLPFYKIKKINNISFILCSWYLIFHKISLEYQLNYNTFYTNDFFSVFTGHLLDFFTLYTLKVFTSLIGINNININLNLNIDFRKYFIFNNNFKSFDLNNVFLILGTNPKVDSPILNIKIKHLKFKFNNKINILYIGSKVLLNYSLIHIGINGNTLINLLFGKSIFCKLIKKVYNIVCLFSIGFNLFLNNTYLITLDVLSFFLKKQNFICSYITLFSSDVSIYELGIVSYYFSKSMFIKNNIKMFYLLGVDYKHMSFINKNNSFNIYHGHHGNIGLKNSSLVLPSNIYIENTTYFLNCEGRFFVSNVVFDKKEKINNNEHILYNLFNYIFFNNRNKYNLKRLFIFFFYKSSFFFTKLKYVNKFYISIKLIFFFLSIFLSNIYFTLENIFFSMDIHSLYSNNIRVLNKASLNNYNFSF